MILDTLADTARNRVEAAKKRRSLEEIRAQALGLPPKSVPFAFERALKGRDLSFICEVKRASPSKGLIAPDFPYLAIAEEYEQAGAAAISVLTEPEYFKGRDHYLTEIRQAVSVPCCARILPWTSISCTRRGCWGRMRCCSSPPC